MKLSEAKQILKANGFRLDESVEISSVISEFKADIEGRIERLNVQKEKDCAILERLEGVFGDRIDSVYLGTGMLSSEPEFPIKVKIDGMKFEVNTGRSQYISGPNGTGGSTVIGHWKEPADVTEIIGNFIENYDGER